jgi:coronin-1B/1C/6
MSATSSIRKSTFRHVFGRPEQSKSIYRDIRFGNSGVDVQPLKANGSYFAVPYLIDGSICVVPLSQEGAVDHETFPYLMHPDKEQVLDFKFSPHDDALLASVHNNGDLCIFRLPGTQAASAPCATLQGHMKRLMQLEWHPLAEGVLATVDAGKLGKLWDVGGAREIGALPDGGYKGLVTSLAWSGDGALLATYAKDKKLRLIDVRANAVVASVDDHAGAKAGQALFANNVGRVLTFGFTRTQGRCYSLWDVRAMDAGRAGTAQIDTNSAAFLPVLDQDTGVLYLGSRGEGTIRTYEVGESALHSLSDFKSIDATSGLAALPKSACDISKNEVAQLLKLTPKRTVAPIHFEVPRQDTFFDERLFPNTWDGKPSMTADQWMQGANTPPTLVSLEPVD